MHLISLSPAGTLDYAAQALDLFSAPAAASDTSFRKEDDRLRYGVIEALRTSEKYLFLNAKDTLNASYASNQSLPALTRLPEPVVCVEFPSPSVAPRGISSSRRMALCLDSTSYLQYFAAAKETNLIAGKDGVCVLSLAWNDRREEWDCLPGAMFLPYSDSPMQSGRASHGMRTLRGSFALALLPKRFSELELLLGAGEAREAIARDLVDEVQVLLYALPLMKGAQVVLQRDTPPERISNGRQPYFPYRVLGTEEPGTAVSLAGAFADVGKPLSSRHISHFGFSSLRRLNHVSSDPIRTADDYVNWLNSLERYEAAQINLFIGVNGSGKSTVIDLIASLDDVAKLATLQRENLRIDSTAGFEVHLQNSCLVTAHFSQGSSQADREAIDWQSVSLAVFPSAGNPRDVTVEMRKFDPDPQSLMSVTELMKSFDADIDYYDASRVSLDSEQAARELCEIGPYLDGLASSRGATPDAGLPQVILDQWPRQQASPVHPRDDARVSLWLSDDLLQTNHVNLAQLPSGWRAFASLLGWLKSRPEGSVCLIEEPETHLHPRLQHLLARRLSAVALERSLQLFISTHSAALIDSRQWQGMTPKIFQAGIHCLQERPSTRDSLRLLEDLGVRQSDFLQANGVIWVEGPSDAMYLEYWLRLYCARYGKRFPEREFSYSIFPYGGAVLRHFGGEGDDILLPLLQLNRNAYVLMDKDLDYQLDSDGVQQPVKRHHVKERIRSAIDLLNSRSCGWWITQGYTIESYLPQSFADDYFAMGDGGRLKQLTSIGKVEIARRFVQASYGYDECFPEGSDLFEQIASLYTAITDWNRR